MDNKIEINLPTHLTGPDKQRVREVLEDVLNNKWDLFKRNATVFFNSLKDLLGDIWNKIASWAHNLWDKFFG